MPRSEQCTSDLSLDRLLAGDLPREDAAALRAHLATCAGCAARYADVKAGFDAWAATPVPLAGARRRGIPLASYGLAAAIVCAAAIAMLLVRPRGQTEPDPPGSRIKGDGFVLYVKHGAQIRAADPQDVAWPGDQLQLVYTAARAGHVAVLGFDGAGVTSVYFPEGRKDAWPAPPGVAVLLPRSVILDDVMGREVIRALHCPRPFALEPIRRALAAAPAGFVPPTSCHAERFALDKQVPR